MPLTPTQLITTKHVLSQSVHQAWFWKTVHASALKEWFSRMDNALGRRIQSAQIILNTSMAHVSSHFSAQKDQSWPMESAKSHFHVMKDGLRKTVPVRKSLTVRVDIPLEMENARCLSKVPTSERSWLLAHTMHQLDQTASARSLCLVMLDLNCTMVNVSRNSNVQKTFSWLMVLANLYQSNAHQDTSWTRTAFAIHIYFVPMATTLRMASVSHIIT